MERNFEREIDLDSCTRRLEVLLSLCQQDVVAKRVVEGESSGNAVVGLADHFQATASIPQPVKKSLRETKAEPHKHWHAATKKEEPTRFLRGVSGFEAGLFRVPLSFLTASTSFWMF